MIGTVKIEFGMMNLYVNNVCVASTSTIAGIRHAVKRYNLQGYLMAAEWKLCFFYLTKFLRCDIDTPKIFKQKNSSICCRKWRMSRKKYVQLIYHTLERLQRIIARIFILTIFMFDFAIVLWLVLETSSTHLTSSHHFCTWRYC